MSIRRFLACTAAILAWLGSGNMASAQIFRSLESHWMDGILFHGPYFERKDTVSMVFIGDVMMHKKQLSYDHRTFLEGVRSRLENADLAVANMEFTLAGKPYSGYPAFSAPDSYADYAADCGIDVFLTANNHILDKGKPGIERTIRYYRDMDHIMFTGISENATADSASYPLIAAVRGIRVALINFTYGTNTGIDSKWPKVNMMDRKDIACAMERAKERGADLIIALPHWGIEYNLLHNREQEDLAAWLAENGADIIIGAHPHVVQDYQEIRTSDNRTVPVYYSMGNAVSNMSATNTRLELIVTVRAEKDAFGDIRLLDWSSEFMWCTLPETLTDSYRTIVVEDYRGRRDLWKDPDDYDNMMTTLKRVSEKTGIGY